MEVRRLASLGVRFTTFLKIFTLAILLLGIACTCLYGSIPYRFAPIHNLPKLTEDLSVFRSPAISVTQVEQTPSSEEVGKAGNGVPAFPAGLSQKLGQAGAARAKGLDIRHRYGTAKNICCPRKDAGLVLFSNTIAPPDIWP